MCVFTKYSPDPRDIMYRAYISDVLYVSKYRFFHSILWYFISFWVYRLTGVDNFFNLSVFIPKSSNYSKLVWINFFQLFNYSHSTNIMILYCMIMWWIVLFYVFLHPTCTTNSKAIDQTLPLGEGADCPMRLYLACIFLSTEALTPITVWQ